MEQQPLGQQPLDFAAAEGQHAERRNLLGLALQRATQEKPNPYLRILVGLVSDATEAGIRGEYRATLAYLIGSPWGLHCARSTAAKTIRDAERLGLLTVRRVAAGTGQADANRYQINWTGIQERLGIRLPAYLLTPQAGGSATRTPGSVSRTPPSATRTPGSVSRTAPKRSSPATPSGDAPAPTPPSDTQRHEICDHGTIDHRISKTHNHRPIHTMVHGDGADRDGPQPVGTAIAAAIARRDDPAEARRRKADLVAYLSEAVADPSTDPSIFGRAADVVIHRGYPRERIEAIAEAVRRKRLAGELKTPGAYFVTRLRSEGVPWESPRQ